MQEVPVAVGYALSPNLFRIPLQVCYTVCLRYYLNERGMFLTRTREYLADKRAWEFQVPLSYPFCSPRP